MAIELPANRSVHDGDIDMVRRVVPGSRLIEREVEVNVAPETALVFDQRQRRRGDVHANRLIPDRRRFDAAEKLEPVAFVRYPDSRAQSEVNRQFIDSVTKAVPSQLDVIGV